MTVTDAASKGEAGIRYTQDGKLIIGQNPTIRQHYSREEEYEMPDGSTGVRPVGPAYPVLDMQPTIIDFAEFLTALIDQNDAGKPVDILGHVRILPTNINDRINLAGEMESSDLL